MDKAGSDLERAAMWHIMRALTRMMKETVEEEQLERALYSLKYGEIYKEIRYGDL